MSLVFIDSGLSVEYTNLFWVYNLLQETETKEMMIVQCNVAQIHMHMYYMRSLQKVSRHLTWKLDAFIEEDTRYRNIVHFKCIIILSIMSQKSCKKYLVDPAKFSKH